MTIDERRAESMTTESIRQASDANVLDLAGRQRMLTQRLGKEALGELLGQDHDTGSTLRLLRVSASALSQGGLATVSVDGAPTKIFVARPISPEVAAAAAEQLERIAEVEREIANLHARHVEGEALAALEQFMAMQGGGSSAGNGYGGNGAAHSSDAGGGATHPMASLLGDAEFGRY